MHRLMAFAVAFLTGTAGYALGTNQVIEGKGKPGLPIGDILTVQGATGGKPIPVTGSFSAAGAADTVGSTATFNANAVCAAVELKGQLGAGFSLAAGTLAATLTPSLSEDAAVPACTGGNWTASAFVDIAGNTAATIVVTNPNAFQQAGIKTLAGSRCARVCTTAFTSGSATGFLVATTVPSPPPAAGADVTDRPARQVGKVYGSDGFPLATANSGRAQVDIITGGGGGATDAAASSAASESATTRSASTSAIRVRDTSLGAGSQLVTLEGTAANGAKVDVKASVLPAGASTEITLAAIKAKTDNLDVLLSTRTKPADTQTVAGSVSVSNFPATQPVSAASLPLPAGAATEATLATRAADSTLTGGTAKAIMRGAAKGATAAADATTTAQGADHQAVDVTLWLAGSALDPRTRSWTLSSGTDSVNVGNFPATYDTSDRAARLLGHVTVDNASIAVTGTFWQATQPVSLAAPVDVSDRAARLLGVLSAGSNIIGKVGIDQTTPGTTNGVQVNAALPAGTNVIGHVIADSGSTTAVSSTVYPTALTSLTTNQLAVTASAQQLPSNAAKVVCIKVLDGGTQNVKFGASGVTTGTGTELVPGESACRPADNTNRFFVIAGATGSTLAWEAWQ